MFDFWFFATQCENEGRNNEKAKLSRHRCHVIDTKTIILFVHMFIHMKNVLDLYCRKKAQYEKTLDPLHDYGFYGFV